MESLASILQGIKERVQANPHEERLPPEPAPCPLCKGQGFLSYGARLGEPFFGEVRACDCQLLTELVSSLDAFKLNPQYPDLTKALDATWEWVNGMGPSILVLAGKRGVGKTHLSEGAALALALSRQPRWFLTDRQLDSMIRRSFDNDSTDDLIQMLDKELNLGIDDFGTVARAKDGSILSIVDDVINLRWIGARNGDTRTLITTNLAPDELEPRMRSRLQDATRARTVVIGAPDYRNDPWGGD